MKIIKFLAEQRMRLSHASTIFNVFGIPLLIIDRIRTLLNLNIHFVILYTICLLGLLIVGYILDKIGWFKAEMTYQAERNEVFEKILRK
jgi:hypothetical protein